MRDIFAKLSLLRIFVWDGFNSWRDNIWDQDLDAPYCCSGYECCCGGDTLREIYNLTPKATAGGE